MNKPLDIVEHLAALNVPKGKFEPTEAQIQRMREEEPTDPQITKLKSLGVSDATILELTKYDASELIEKLEAAYDAPGSIVPSQEKVLLGYGYTPEQLSQLSRSQAKKLIGIKDAQRTAARNSR